MSKDPPLAPRARARRAGPWLRRLTCAALLLGAVGLLGSAGAPETSRAAAAATAPRRIGQLGGYGAALAVEGDRAYFSTDRRLHTADLRDPAQPRLLGQSAELPDLLQDIALQVGLAVVAAGNAGLWLLDVSDPAAPRPLGSLATPGVARGVAVDGGLAYVAAGPAGLLVVDIARPDRPRLLAIANTPGDAGDVLLRDGHAFVADWTGGLRVFNVADARGPVEVAELKTEGRPLQLGLEEARLHVLQRGGGLLLVDVALPAAPRVLKRLVGLDGTALATHGHLIFVAEEDGGLHVADVSDPANPKLLHLGKPVPGLAPKVLALSPAGAGSRLAVLGIDDSDTVWLRLMDISDPAQPRLQGQVSAGAPPLLHAIDIAFMGSYACVLDMRAELLRIVDLSEPLAPRPVGELTMPLRRGLPNIRIDGHYAYVNHDESFSIVDLQDPSRPVLMSTLHVRNIAGGLAVSKGHAYLAAGGEGLKVLDVGQPSDPRVVNLVGAMGQVTNVVLDPARALAYAISDTGFHVLDLADPAQPRPLSFLAKPDLVSRALEVVGEQVFVACCGEMQTEAGTILVIDAAVPAAPQAAAVVDLPMVPGRMIVAVGSAYLVDNLFHEGRLFSAGLTLPQQQRTVHVQRLARPSFALAVHDGLLVVGSGHLGLELFSTFPPPMPSLPHHLSLPWLRGGRGGDVGGG